MRISLSRTEGELMSESEKNWCGARRSKSTIYLERVVRGDPDFYNWLEYKRLCKQIADTPIVVSDWLCQKGSGSCWLWEKTLQVDPLSLNVKDFQTGRSGPWPKLRFYRARLARLTTIYSDRTFE